jgi:isoleucyl-tRNA synthetase
MPFAKVETQFDFPAQERSILEFWQRTQAFEKLRAQNRGKPRWSFLDGPITANNPMGVHHAWGRTYKDVYQRFFAMTGHELRYQNGFDCQGLWVEVEVEKEFKLRSKQDIESLVPGDKFKSIDQFVQRCKQRVDRFAKVQTEQSIRLGMWMDWDRDEDWQKPPDQRRSYFTMSEENNYTIWSFLKKCHGRGLVYKAYDSMPWCPRCAVGISQMEMHEGYQLVAHRAVFVRFPLRNRPGENLLIWTTTPWTLSSNVGAAVNPDLTYVKVKHQDQIYYLAKGALTANRLEEDFKRGNWVDGVPKLKPVAQLFKEKGGYEVVGELKGRDMLGWSYDGPFDELAAQGHPYGFPEELAKVVRAQRWSPATSSKAAHRVIAWDAVGETEGTGIVHIAPGCGKEDFELGKKEGLPPIAPLDEEGHFLPGFEALEGKSAVDSSTADAVFESLKAKGLLVAIERYPHNYPHCWRCKTELLFRLVDEWYISMAWRDEIMKICYDIQWIPEFGLQRELDWLKNMGDWMISKKRYWGLALPIWVDEKTGDFEVIGSREELRARAVEGWNEFEGHSAHRPWIDLIKIRNPKTGNLMSRIPDVGNPWLDAGIVPYSTVKYNSDPEYWNQWFPADFITECFPGQFRNWFYALLAMSTMMTGRAPFKVLLGHALVRDQDGEEMHKSAGNAIAFDGAADEGYTVTTKAGKQLSCPPMSADVMRWMYCRHNPVNNLNFGPAPAEEIRSKFILKLWNCYAFFCNYARQEKGGFDLHAAEVPVRERPDIDRWILSKLQLLIRTAHRELPKFNVQSLCLEAERFVDECLSNWYVRRNRDRFWGSQESRDKLAAFQTLYAVLTTLTKLLAPVIPFLTETLYQNLVAQPSLDLTSPDRKGGVAGKTPPLRSGLVCPESVHLCDYPEVDETLIDADLSADMDALLRLASLGLAARNTVKIKVRQPLAEMKVQPAEIQDRRAVERFANQLCEELNVKRVTIHEPSQGALLQDEVKPNMKTLGPKFGPRLKEVQDLIAKAKPAELAQKAQAGQSIELNTPIGPITLEPGDVVTSTKSQPGWTALAEGGTVVALDVTLTDALKREGQAREVVRHVQNLRKEADLELEDRITLFLSTPNAELSAAIAEHRDYITSETLTKTLSTTPLSSAAATDVKVEGRPLHIELKKA